MQKKDFNIILLKIIVFLPLCIISNLLCKLENKMLFYYTNISLLLLIQNLKNIGLYCKTHEFCI